MIKTIKDILYHVNLISTSGQMSHVVKNISFDSRKVEKGTLFVAVKGTLLDGHDYIDQAIKMGAICIVCDQLPTKTKKDVTYIQTPNSANALGHIAANFYDDPSKKLKLIGITGTNGKTTTATLLYKLFRSLGYNAGLLSTIENLINDEVIPASHTTPDAISLNVLLDQMVKSGCQYAFMEVSSHAIAQHRITGLAFSGAVFMNISHDHLDYHKTFEKYITAKKVLFDGLSKKAFALVNLDDKRGQVMMQNTKARQYSFGLKFMTDFKAKIITNSYQGLELDINNQNVWFKLIGSFNAYNLLAAYAVAELLNEAPDEILMLLSGLETAPGRFEPVKSGSDIIALVDYAHTPDALENVLQNIANFRLGSEQVITVVGCGGDRDKQKRPVMASIAVKWSDKVIFTNDNPRFEAPQGIINDMLKGVSKAYVKKTLIIPDRKEAIKTACSIARDHDIVLVAGKGHEDYQEIEGHRKNFDDREVLKEMLDLFNS